MPARLAVEILDRLAGIHTAWSALIVGAHNRLILTEQDNAKRFALQMESLVAEFVQMGYEIPSRYRNHFPLGVVLKDRAFDSYKTERVEHIFAEAEVELERAASMKISCSTKRYQELVKSYEDLGFYSVDFLSRMTLKSASLAKELLDSCTADLSRTALIDVRPIAGQADAVEVFLPRRHLDDFVRAIGLTNIANMRSIGIATSLPGMKDQIDVLRCRAARSQSLPTNVVSLR